MTTYTAPSPSIAHPDPVRWLWYTFGGRLGPRYREWVLHDLTCRTRWERQLARAVVQVVPLAAVVLLALGFSWITWVGVGCGLVLALWYSIAPIDQTAERRLVKHGYEPGTLELALHERYLRENEDRIVRYMATYRNMETGDERC